MRARSADARSPGVVTASAAVTATLLLVVALTGCTITISGPVAPGDTAPGAAGSPPEPPASDGRTPPDPGLAAAFEAAGATVDGTHATFPVEGGGYDGSCGGWEITLTGHGLYEFDDACGDVTINGEWVQLIVEGIGLLDINGDSNSVAAVRIDEITHVTGTGNSISWIEGVLETDVDAGHASNTIDGPPR